MNRQKQLLLNFFPLTNKSVMVHCFRQRCKAINESKPGDGFYHFKEKGVGKDDVGWWLRTETADASEPFTFASDEYPHAAKWVLTHQLFPVIAQEINNQGRYWAKVHDHFWPRLDVGVARHEGIGWQGFVLEFDWNPQVQRHGMYVNFHFFKENGIGYGEGVQRLSLSLDEQGSPNRDLFRKRHDWLATFHKRFLKDKTWLLPNGDSLSFDNMLSLQGQILEGKTLEFSGRQLFRNAYWGLRTHGPYKRCGEEPTFFFVFREKHRADARSLYGCLCGREYPDRFPGMWEFFKVPFGSGNIRHVVMDGPEEEMYAKAAKTVAESGCQNPVAIVLVEGDEKEYLLQKSAFLEKDIPSQDVRVGNIRSGRNFQWSVAGLALQLFCKAGGIPWCVQTRFQHDLIIGISQLWCDEELGRNRYVAYSVTTDANGFFKDIRTLSDSTDESDYVAKLGERIKAHLVEQLKAGTDKPERIVLHCSFRLRKSAMEAIRHVVAEVKNENPDAVQIVIMRVNTEHHYEAFDGSHATMVPDENTILKIQRGQYLVWPDGTPSGGVMPTRPSSPLFVAFDRCEPPLTQNTEIDLLQGLCNLSGANWRGFNAKARPVSVFYCHLVGRMMSDMAKYHLQLPRIEKMVPWFL